MIKTTSHLAYLLKVEEKEFAEIVILLDHYYYEKIEFKYNKDGSIKKDILGKPKLRILNPSLDRLKIIQTRILENVLAKITLPDYMYGGIKKRDNIKNAKRHQGKKFIFTTDLKNFFPSIKHSMVYDMFIQHNFSHSVARVLTQLTTFKGKLPQGTPTSSLLANLVLASKIGSSLETYCSQNNITFTTFIDDLTFSSPTDFKEKTPLILDIIKSSFKISQNKTNYKSKNPVVTGVVVKNNCLDVTINFKDKLQNTIGKTSEQIEGLIRYELKVKSANKKK